MASFTGGGVLPKFVKDLPGWPPCPGGASGPHTHSTEHVTIEHVLRYVNEKLMFTCKYGGASVSYDFAMPDENTANKVAAILRDHVGRTLISIAFVEIPVDNA